MIDDELKSLLSATKVEASDNLKYRVMQQIKTEKMLGRAKPDKARSIVATTLTVFGVMYALIGVLAVSIYINMGVQELETNKFFIPAFIILVVCSVYWAISCFDESRHSTARNKKQK